MDTDKRYLIDVFDVVNCFRKEINECLKAMGFEPLPLNVTTYPEVINHIEKVKAVIENRGKDLKSEQSILAEYKEKELAAKLQCTNSLIDSVNRDIVILNKYKKNYESRG